MAANGSELDYELYEDALIYSLYGKIFIRNLTTKKASSNVIKVMLFVGNVIERELRNRNLKAITSGRKTLELEDIVARTSDSLDFSERIIKWELGYGHLVVATAHQVHIFNENYINTPIIIDGRSDIKIIILGKK